MRYAARIGERTDGFVCLICILVLGEEVWNEVSADNECLMDDALTLKLEPISARSHGISTKLSCHQRTSPKPLGRLTSSSASTKAYPDMVDALQTKEYRRVECKLINPCLYYVAITSATVKGSIASARAWGPLPRVQMTREVIRSTSSWDILLSRILLDIILAGLRHTTASAIPFVTTADHGVRYISTDSDTDETYGAAGGRGSDIF